MTALGSLNEFENACGGDSNDMARDLGEEGRRLFDQAMANEGML